MDLGGVLERPPQQPLAPGPPGRPPLISLRNREQKRGRNLLPINASRAQGAAHNLKRGVAHASGGLLATALLTATTALTAALDPDPLNIGGPARVLLEVRAVVGPLLICGDGGWLGHVGVAFLCVVQAAVPPGNHLGCYDTRPSQLQPTTVTLPWCAAATSETSCRPTTR